MSKYVSMYAYIYIYIYIYTHTHTHTHTHMYTYTHTHIHAYIHEYRCAEVRCNMKHMLRWTATPLLSLRSSTATVKGCSRMSLHTLRPKYGYRSFIGLACTKQRSQALTSELWSYMCSLYTYIRAFKRSTYIHKYMQSHFERKTVNSHVQLPPDHNLHMHTCT